MKPIITLLLVLGLVAFAIGCSTTKEDDDLASENMRYYTQLQENIIDREDFQRGLILENLEIKYELALLSQQMKLLAKHRSDDRIIGSELPNPKDRITQDKVRYSPSRVTLDIEGVQTSYVIDSNSMDPLLDAGATVLSVYPRSPQDISVGDIVIFSLDSSSVPIVHRVHSIGNDNEGIFYITKGDNNENPDHYPVRYEDIVSVVVGILY